jgi:polyisoprenoid-binding protein YceI
VKKIATLLFLLLAKLSMAQLKPVDEKSKLMFYIKNLGFKTSGTFNGLQGQVRFDPAKPATSFFDVSINAASVNTDNNLRDEHLRGETYFDVKKFPIIHFVSSAVTAGKKKGEWQLNGKLTIKDITKDISFPFSATPSGNGYLFNGQFTINRKDFHIGGSSPVSDNLDVVLEVMAL